MTNTIKPKHYKVSVELTNEEIVNQLKLQTKFNIENQLILEINQTIDECKKDTNVKEIEFLILEYPNKLVIK